MKLDVIKREALARPSSIGRLYTDLKLSAPAWSVVVAGLVLVVYLLWLPFIDRTWRATGDEPHYLLAAHSMVRDRDLDLKNNYDQLDYLNFYLSQDITRQVRSLADGQQILDHYLGYPLLIAPAYGLSGRSGVLLFQAILGGLLAGLTFQLSVLISRNEWASLLATLAVALTPPLLMYHYLIYPELIGALLTTFILYWAIKRTKPTPIVGVLVVLSLVMLPWLNRRFVPLAGLLVLLVLWAWRGKAPLLHWNVANWSRARWAGLLSLTGIILSTLFLVGFNSQLSDPLRQEFTTPTGLLIFERLARSVGWLVDQQRGLFVFAPVYVLALFGLPVSLERSWRRRDRDWFSLLPIVLVLGLTGLAGAFWIAWELGPRFLVVALPALAPLIALAWARYKRSVVWWLLAIGLLAVSLLNSLVIMQNPELPYKSSLPLYYSERLGLDLTRFLPDMAGYARLVPNPTQAGDTQAQSLGDGDRTVWYTPAGDTALLLNSPPLEQLPFGHYHLSWPMRVDPGLPPSTEIVRLSINMLGGGQLLNKTITAADLPSDGSYGLIELEFVNPNVDRWRTPLLFNAISSGQSQIWADYVLFEPVWFYGWGLPYIFVGLITLGAGLAWWWGRRDHAVTAMTDSVRLPQLSALAGWGMSALLLVGGFGYLTNQSDIQRRTYDAAHLMHLTGQTIADPETDTGQAWLVDPAVDAPQKATYGPFDFYDAGQYHITFRMKLPTAVEGDQEVALLQVNATANFEPLLTQPLRSTNFTQPDMYHDFVLTVTNPRRQALSFDVHYLGVAPLAIESVTISKIGEMR